jgi:hypothetical protein
MPHEKRVADELENGAPAAGSAAALGEAAGHGLDGVEDGRDLVLVMRERDALRERVGDHEEAFGRGDAQRDRPTRRDLLLPVRRNIDRNDFFFAINERSDDPRLDAPENLILLERRQPDQDRSPETEQGHKSVP